MTRKVFVTDIMEVKTVKVRCRKCGYAVEIPLDNPKACPDGCSRCMVLFAPGAIAQLLKSILDLQHEINGSESRLHYMQILIETEEEQA